VRRAAPDVVLVTLGTNDAPGAQVAEATAALMDQIREAAPNALVIWWGPPTLLRADIVDRPSAIADLQRPEVSGRGGRYVDSRRYTREDHAPDGVHFTRVGYEHWGRRALGATFWIV
jgi:lysophospholipase L1-like esterase